MHSPLKTSLDDHTPDNHLAQHRVQRLEIENQVQLAHILKQPVQRLDKHLDQIQQRQRRFRRRADQDKVQRRVVSVRH